jgi:hypothetical protein
MVIQKVDRRAIVEREGCIFSADRVYRYSLWRMVNMVGEKSNLMIIGLNPSTADEVKDDPTIRRCMRFAKEWGFRHLVMANLFAFRSPSPTVMKRKADPVGPDNDMHLIELARDAGMVLAAWGVHGAYLARDKWAAEHLGQMMCLGTTSGGHPRHPLYVSSVTQPVLWSSGKS